MGPQPEASCVAQPLAEEPSEPFSSPYLIAGRQPVEEGVAKWPPHLECDQASENRNRTSCRRDEIREDIEGPREGKRPPSVFREAGGSAGLAKRPGFQCANTLVCGESESSRCRHGCQGALGRVPRLGLEHRVSRFHCKRYYPVCGSRCGQQAADTREGEELDVLGAWPPSAHVSEKCWASDPLGSTAKQEGANSLGRYRLLVHGRSARPLSQPVQDPEAGVGRSGTAGTPPSSSIV